MKDADIVLMQEMEERYWWHISRRLILQSILLRHAESFGSAQDRFISASKNQILKRVQDDATDPSIPLRYAQDDKGATPESDMRSWTSQDDDARKSSSILDIGCGGGRNMQWLKSFGKVIGVDNNPKAIEFCQQYGTTILADAAKLPLPDGSFDLITAFDVLEHLEDDKSAIKEWGRVLNNGGYLFISVPAYQWLFSSRDKQLGHYRRYNLHNLVQLLRNENFEPIFTSYIFALVFPFFVIQRLFFQKGTASVYPKFPQFIDSFLMKLSNLEANLIKFIRFPFGGSIVILAKRL